MVYTWLNLEVPDEWTASRDDVDSLFDLLEVVDVQPAVVNASTDEEFSGATSPAFDRAARNGWESFTFVFGSTECGGWVTRLYDRLLAVPTDVGESWAPWELLLSFSASGDASFRVEIAIGGDGAPSDFDEYLRFVRELEPFGTIEAWLRDRSAGGWRVQLAVE